jgi:hypothetical protein
MAKYREVGRVFEAFQWQPGVETPLVTSTTLRGFDPVTGDEMQLVRYQVTDFVAGRTRNIMPGDWIIDTYDGFRVMRDEDFQRNFIPVER